LTIPDITGWTWLNQAGATEALVNSNKALVISGVSTGSQALNFFGGSIGAAPWTVITALELSEEYLLGATPHYRDGLTISDGTKFERLTFSYSDQTTYLVRFNDAVTQASFESAGNIPRTPILFHAITNDGVILRYYTSIDPTNLGWTLDFTELVGSFLGFITRAGVSIEIFDNAVGTPHVGGAFISFAISNSVVVP